MLAFGIVCACFMGFLTLFTLKELIFEGAGIFALILIIPFILADIHIALSLTNNISRPVAVIALIFVSLLTLFPLIVFSLAVIAFSDKENSDDIGMMGMVGMLLLVPTLVFISMTL